MSITTAEQLLEQLKAHPAVLKDFEEKFLAAVEVATKEAVRTGVPVCTATLYLPVNAKFLEHIDAARGYGFYERDHERRIEVLEAQTAHPHELLANGLQALIEAGYEIRSATTEVFEGSRDSWVKDDGYAVTGSVVFVPKSKPAEQGLPLRSW
jgi:hypothetical protein